MARSFSFARKRGDTISIALTISRNGSAIDLTGATIWFTAKEAVEDADVDAVFQKTTADGITIDDAPNGRATVVIEPADTAALGDDPVTLLCDVQVEEADGTTSTVAEGVLRITPDVTRAT